MSSNRFVDLPKPGDLIEIFHDGYEHWAVYVGDGYMVHMINRDSEISGVRLMGSVSGMSNRGEVRKDLLAKETKGQKWRINNKYDEKMQPLCAKEIIRRAEENVGKEMPYNLATYNCEHFATELRYGVPMCEQVQDKAPGVLAGLGVILAGIVTFFRYGSRLPSSTS